MTKHKKDRKRGATKTADDVLDGPGDVSELLADKPPTHMQSSEPIEIKKEESDESGDVPIAPVFPSSDDVTFDKLSQSNQSLFVTKFSEYDKFGIATSSGRFQLFEKMSAWVEQHPEEKFGDFDTILHINTGFKRPPEECTRPSAWITEPRKTGFYEPPCRGKVDYNPKDPLKMYIASCRTTEPIKDGGPEVRAMLIITPADASLDKFMAQHFRLFEVISYSTINWEFIENVVMLSYKDPVGDYKTQYSAFLQKEKSCKSSDGGQERAACKRKRDERPSPSKRLASESDGIVCVE